MQLSLLILSCIWVIAGADGDSPETSLSIMLLRFENLQGVLADGKPCSLFSFIGLQCTMEMKIKVTIGDKEHDWIELGQVTSGSNKVDFTENTYNKWSNPMTIKLDDKPFEGFKLTAQITSHGLPVDYWTHEFADGSQPEGVSSYTSTRPGLLGTTLTVAWTTTTVSPPSTSTPETTVTTAVETTTTPEPARPKACDEITDDRTDGPKQIYINDKPIWVYCQFGTSNAYTVIQSRGSADEETFDRTLEEYKKPFGKVDKPDKGNNFWLGLDNMVALTANGSYSLLIELCCGGKLVQQQHYEKFQVVDEDYKLKAETTLSTGLNFFSTTLKKTDIDSPFATYDTFNQDDREFCEILKYYGEKEEPILDKQTGGWWFGSCANNLNGKFVASKDSKCELEKEYYEFPDKTTGIQMRTTSGNVGNDGRAFDGVSYDRVRMAVYKSGSIPDVTSSFCS